MYNRLILQLLRYNNMVISHNFLEVGVGFKAVQIASHHLMAEGIVSLRETDMIYSQNDHT